MGRLRPATRMQTEEAIPLALIPTAENVVDNTQAFSKRYGYTATPDEVRLALRALRRKAHSSVTSPSYTARQTDALVRFQRERRATR